MGWIKHKSYSSWQSNILEQYSLTMFHFCKWRICCVICGMNMVERQCRRRIIILQWNHLYPNTQIKIKIQILLLLYSIDLRWSKFKEAKLKIGLCWQSFEQALIFAELGKGGLHTSSSVINTLWKRHSNIILISHLILRTYYWSWSCFHILINTLSTVV